MTTTTTRRATIPPLTADQQALAEAYLPLALAMARRRSERRPRKTADWYEAAYLGLTLAAESWDEARSTSGKFAAHAITLIRQQFNNVRVAARPKGYRRRLDGSVPVGAPATLPMDDDHFGPGDHPPSREPAPDARILAAEEAAERRAEVERLLGLLPPGRAAVLRGLYLEEKSGAEVAAELGIPLASVRSVRFYAVAKLSRTAGRRRSA